MALKKARAGTRKQTGGVRLGDIAYARILETLFERKITAGAFHSQSELVELVGVPVAPLRDALKLLEAEGIVTIHQRSGIQFVRPGFELTRATYQYRGIIEGAAAAVYAETADESEINELEKRHLELIATIEHDGLSDACKEVVEELETMFHNAVVGSLANPLIDRSHRRLHNYVRLIRLDRVVTTPLVLRSLREHLNVIIACKARDSKAASEAMQAHLSAALQRGLGLYG